MAAIVAGKRTRLSLMLQTDIQSNATSVPLAPEWDSTVDGCTCTSECGASVGDGFACDWCYVKSGCGRTTLGQPWDYCVYQGMHEFEQQDHSVKMTQIWDDITAPDVVHKSAHPKGITGVVSQILGESMRTTLDNHRDVLPNGRTKVIHTQGVHCQFQLDIVPDSKLTGIFEPGTRKGLIRMGSGTSRTLSFFPGMGIKFFRSGVHSANFVALRATGPGGSNDFFNGTLSNHVAPPAALQALMKFQQASNCAPFVGLSDVCSYSQEGEKVDEPQFPFEILFQATGQFRIPDEHEMSDDELLIHLSKIPVETHLFDVYTIASPKAAAEKLGKLTTSSECVQSLFGDTRLSFKHQRIEEDFLQRPSWTSDVNFTGCEATSAPASKWQCPGVQ
eukprot:CAMPEP_0197625496 /NCGR_PEP_ID=MMETSP1338-20131121/4852_1 /TAXON_ID=43686 ORGANISM="Pelagodinium beii, Strain RCC1491" /NCGR_SAMPLE_ID=MMETSP1338 /ASSEMBLY_ACC=CAM_ASM_000754 /LENGTH=389 /DNA_ID=CAMNT_0043195923 /DNA_START=24 /DNA_END=1193 /DNA_ORIENTATION=+